MARPPQDPQIRINQILDAAEDLFHSNGYHKTKVSNIVKRIGVTQGTFYYYFNSKEELIGALINRRLSKFGADMEKMVSSSQIEPDQKISLMVSLVYKTIRLKKGFFLDYLYSDQYLHFIDKFFRQSKKILAPFLLRILEEGCHKKIFKVLQKEINIEIYDSGDAMFCRSPLQS
jgi:AcrR family transcriptional regulator